jgi:hypothetical protein
MSSSPPNQPVADPRTHAVATTAIARRFIFMPKYNAGDTANMPKTVKSPRHLRVKVQEYGEQRLEALGYPARMEFELEDGSVVELAHPWLWDDDVQAAYEEAKTTGEIARAVLGNEEHKRFVAGGGKSTQIVLAIGEMREQPKAAGDPADPKPKPS